MKKFLKNESGAVPFVAAIWFLAVAVAGFAGVIDVKHPTNPPQFEKLKSGTPGGPYNK